MSQIVSGARRLGRCLSWYLLPVMVLIFALPYSASAQEFSVTITVDENGNGHFSNTNGFSSTLASGMQADPGPGGLASALTYSLLNPPELIAGDLILMEPGSNV